jgi:hypothetical protein
LRLTITHCPYCGTPLKFLFQNLDEWKRFLRIKNLIKYDVDKM